MKGDEDVSSNRTQINGDAPTRLHRFLLVTFSVNFSIDRLGANLGIVETFT